MNKKLKSEKGAITLVVLVTMLFLIAFLMTLFLRVANKAQTSAETTEQIKQKYNNLEDEETIYQSYFADEEVIPIYTVEQLKKIGSGEQVEVEQEKKIYIFKKDGYYVLKNNLNLGGKYDEETKTWTGTQWEPLPPTDESGTIYEFTGTLDGAGHEITGLYINNENLNNQGLFGTLEGTVKNITISNSYVKAKNYVGSIAGKNNGTIQNCYNSGIIIGDTNVTGGYFKSITTGEILNIWNTETIQETLNFISGKDVAVVPKGFRVSLNTNEQTIKDGMVILDNDKNEYVWVPVENEDGKLVRTEWSNNKPTGTISSKYTETLPDDLVNSVKAYKGFYIGRYEAGSNTVRTSATKDTLTEVLIKKGLYPYNYVNYKDAVSKIEEMYTDKETYGVDAIMPYGAMWDETLNFVKDDAHDVTNSTKWGNYDNSIFSFTGAYCEKPNETSPIYTKVTNTEKKSSKQWLLTTGASEQNKAKNIYDLAGNVKEWTQESRSTSYRVYRGGSCVDYGNAGPASYRYGNNPSYTSVAVGFRSALYIK